MDQRFVALRLARHEIIDMRPAHCEPSPAGIE
jgi:hypothetical protein